jgi:DNA-binding response OmpR family regulator
VQCYLNRETKSVIKGITHLACDYLLKPVCIEELNYEHLAACC